MKLDIKKMWIDALLSGDYPQGRGSLQCEGRYCCLGVLTDLYVKTHYPDKTWHDLQSLRDAIGVKNDFFVEFLPTKVMEWAGLKTSYAGLDYEDGGYLSSLATLNDKGKTFEEIASIIDDHF